MNPLILFMLCNPHFMWSMFCETAFRLPESTNKLQTKDKE